MPSSALPILIASAAVAVLVIACARRLRRKDGLRAAAPPPTAARAAAVRRPGGGLRVLVVDDDEAVRELACQFLERADIEALTADGGTEALRIFDADPESIDLVLLDLGMPDLDGRQTCAEIRRRRPDTPVILVSGYDAEMAAARFADGGAGIEFLAKPYSAEELIERIRHCTTA